MSGVEKQLAESRISSDSAQVGTTNPTEVLSPVAVLNDDVLASIFEAAMSHSRSHSRWTRQDPPLEIVLSRVTSRWRDVAVANPRMWRFINNFNHLENIQIYLERSGAYPIDIHISIGGNESHENNRLNLLMAHIHRWRSLSVESETYDDFYEVLMPLRHKSAPNLQSLYIYLTHDAEPTGRDLMFFGGGTPRLATLEFYNIMPMHFRVPSQAVTSLRLTDCADAQIHCGLQGAIDRPELRRLFLEMPALETLSADGNYFDLSYEKPIDAVPSLRSLSLTDGGSIQLLNVYNPSAFPGLEYLMINWEDHAIRRDSQEEELEFFWEFFCEAPCKFQALRTLVLLAEFPNEFSSANYKNFIRSFPLLTEFACSEDIGDLLNALMAPRTSGRQRVRWPSLQSITVCQVDFDLLCGFVTHRMEWGAPLRTIRLLPDVEFPEGKEEWLRQHVQVDLLRFHRLRGTDPKDYLSTSGFRDPLYSDSFQYFP